ncbi:structural cement protein Gp24 [Thorsellia anophelis]|uniref:Bacteriophage lambda head decoration protein D n=1 Tax=Thorsellia anophelis DSM 18579 TaxID=1123402 RepID=A0A1I0CDK3_9GAMM|nr:hypothetical protein [Thorsellia anophelis]SET17180.1 hypothetical protein SAMN02583745_01576 [Thorsellia anophelis DSM 18579]
MGLYRQDKTKAFAGQIARVGESLARATGEPNEGNVEVRAGHFVAIGAEYGCKAISSKEDIVLGVVVRDLLQGIYRKDETPSVGRIGHGDALWVVAHGEFMRGDSVYILTKDGNANSGIFSGSAVNEAVEDNTIATGYIVEQVGSGLVMISRKEA